MKSLRLGLTLALLCAVAFVVTVAPASATGKEIFAKALDTKSCGSEWHFVITDINPVPAPENIWVVWQSGGPATEVPLDKQVGNVAHYSDYVHSASDQVVEAYTYIDVAWDANFNLSHRLCASPSPTSTPVPPTETPIPPTATPVPPTATTVPPTETPTDEDTGRVSVTKWMCTHIGDQDTCTSDKDYSLEGYKVDFKVYQGGQTEAVGDLKETITVTLGKNNNGSGSTGGGAMGDKTGKALDLGTYTVCEVPLAYKDALPPVALDAFPRPKSSQGGSSGGTNQTQWGDNCIVVQLTKGTAEVKFLDIKIAPIPTPTNTPVPPTETPVPPTATNTPVTPGVTTSPSVATPTNTAVPPTATNTPVTPGVTTSPSVATKVPTSTPSSTVLPKTGDPQSGSLALIGLVLALGGALAYRLASAQRPSTDKIESGHS
jgi:LPXTG-motif cell wall-anchored protein